MSKIPEGTQFIEAGCGEKGFRKFEKGCWWFFEGFWRHVDWKMGALTPVTEHPDYAVPAPPWTGEGLPPVGTVCEFAGFNPEETMPTDPRVGDQVTVIAHFMSGSFEVAAFTFYAPPEFEYLQVSQGAYGCFRPIRTPEQIAEEARIAELNLMVGVIKDYPGGRHGVDHLAQLKIQEEACIDLYDAGWRKQVAP